MLRNGWTLLFHPCISEQIRQVHQASERARRTNPEGAETNANVKLFAALSHLLLDAIPQDPTHKAYRQGKTLGTRYRHWRRAKFAQRFRVFFRFDTRSKVIVYGWANDHRTLRAAGARSDPYTVFSKMLAQNNPPDDWASLVSASEPHWRPEH